MIVVKIYANGEFMAYKRGTYIWDYTLNIGQAQIYKEDEIERIKKEMEFIFKDVSWEGYEFEYKMVKCYLIEGDEIVHSKLDEEMDQSIINTNIECAKNLLDVLDDETISERIGLDLEIIKKLRNKF